MNADFADSAVCISLAFIFGVISIILSTIPILQHLANYNHPKSQRYVVRLLLFVPVYTVGCLLILCFPSKYVYIEAVRDIWEAVVVYSFFALILDYCGGENSCAVEIARCPGSIVHPPPMPQMAHCLSAFGCKKIELVQKFLNIFTEPIPLNLHFIRVCKSCVLQFILFKPLMAVGSIIFHSVGSSKNGFVFVIITLLYNLSICTALYGLYLFFQSVRLHPGLADKRPIFKFVAIKLVIVATWYQAFFIQFIPGFTMHNTVMWTNSLLCLEMLLFVWLNNRAYPVEEFVALSDHSGAGAASMNCEIAPHGSLWTTEGLAVNDAEMESSKVNLGASVDAKTVIGKPIYEVQDEYKGSAIVMGQRRHSASRRKVSVSDATSRYDEEPVIQEISSNNVDRTKTTGKQQLSRSPSSTSSLSMTSHGAVERQVKAGFSVAGVTDNDFNPLFQSFTGRRNVENETENGGHQQGRQTIDGVHPTSEYLPRHSMDPAKQPTDDYAGRLNEFLRYTSRSSDVTDVIEQPIDDDDVVNIRHPDVPLPSSPYFISTGIPPPPPLPSADTMDTSPVPSSHEETRNDGVLNKFKVSHKHINEKTIRNVCDAVLMTDVVSDAYYNFHSKYKSHALLVGEDEVSESEIESK